MTSITVGQSEKELFNLCALIVPGYKPTEGKKSPKIETLECTSITLYFTSDRNQTAEERRLIFESGFKFADSKWMDECDERRKMLNAARYHAQKPTQISMLDRIDSRRASAPIHNMPVFQSSVSNDNSSSSQTLRGIGRSDSVPFDFGTKGSLSQVRTFTSISSMSLQPPKGKTKSRWW
jgi:hypothetical protein